MTGSSKSGGNIGGGNGSSNSGSGGGGGGGYWDRMGRSGSKKSLGAGGGNRGAVSEIPLYSREDIREQYCINSRKEPLDSGRRSKGFFGCLTSRKVCTNHHFFFPPASSFHSGSHLTFSFLFFRLIFAKTRTPSFSFPLA